jgi:hypothetical protein
MLLFWAFKLSFVVEILVLLGYIFQKLGEILFKFLVTLPTTLFSNFMAKMAVEEDYSEKLV